ncbi:MAG: ABC transporter substrate-binding protein [Candidatus Gastranaerophilales bacterium]|nr:ABC transporter substrate-binding protein [Candidatus Gastranaerophilales bacterium]
MKKISKILILILFICILLTSCFSADRPKETQTAESEQITARNFTYAEPKEVVINGREFLQSELPVGTFGGEFITSTIGEGPKTFNPWTAKDNTSAEIGALMFDSLLSTDVNTGEVRPNMAKTIKISPDNKEYTITLRKGLKWSDGKEITADDVVFTWKEIILAGFGNTSVRDSVVIDGQLPKVEKIDRYTVKFTTIKPYAPFIRFLSENIAPAHVLRPVTKQGKRAFDSFWGTNTPPEKFVTSGAFRLKEYVPAQRVVLTRYDNYFMVNKDGKQLPYLDKYVIQIVGDLNNELLKFEAGELDIISVRGSDAARFKANEKKNNYTLYNLGASTGTMFFAFNLNNRKNKDGKYYVEPKKQKWFRDKNFRTAVDYAIDRESEVMNILNGVGEPLFTPEAIGSIFLNEKVAKGHKRDFVYAEECLKKSGFYRDGKGFLRDKNNSPVEFDLLTNAGNTEREAIGVMIKSDLAELGIKVNFKPIEFNTLIGKISDTYEWDTMIMGFTGNTLEPHSGKNVWYSNGPLHIFNQRDENDYNKEMLDFERKVDVLFDKGASELEYEKRKIYYDEFQEIIADECPMIYLYSPLRLIAVKNRVGNVYPTILGGVIHNLPELYIK